MTFPELPGLPRPIARGASRCHALALRDNGTMVAACGIRCGTFCGEANFKEGMRFCPAHEDPLCAACIEIVETWLRSEAWEGP